MSAEKTFYTIIAVIVVVAGIGIGAAYYDSVSSVHSSTSTSAQPSSSLTLIITANNWFNNSIHPNHGGQPAFFVLEPNGTLASSASITLPSHQLISLTIIDYDSGASNVLGPVNTTNASQVVNSSEYAKVIGAVGGVEYVYNSSAQYENATLSSSTTNGININHGAGWAVSSLPWNNTLGGYMVTHTFTVTNSTGILLNIPTWAGNNPNGGAVTHASFYLNQTGTFMWQCYAPCGTGPAGWDGAMATAGWMTGTVIVS